MPQLKLGRYIDFAGNEYEVTDIAAHSQTNEKMIIYYAIAQGGLLVCPFSVWSETENHNGSTLARFTHIDDIPKTEIILPDKPEGINKLSPPQEKIDLFLSLFSGRTNVYAKRWESIKTGKSGYSPDCSSAWTPLCPKHDSIHTNIVERNSAAVRRTAAPPFR